MTGPPSETATERRERRAQALWQVQGAGLPWTTLTQDERRGLYALADAVEASDMDAAIDRFPEGSTDAKRSQAAPGLRAHVPVVAAMQDVVAAANDGWTGARLHNLDPTTDEIGDRPATASSSIGGRALAIGRSLAAVALVMAIAAGLLTLGLMLAGGGR